MRYAICILTLLTSLTSLTSYAEETTELTKAALGSGSTESKKKFVDKQMNAPPRKASDLSKPRDAVKLGPKGSEKRGEHQEKWQLPEGYELASELDLPPTQINPEDQDSRATKVASTGEVFLIHDSSYYWSTSLTNVNAIIPNTYTATFAEGFEPPSGITHTTDKVLLNTTIAGPPTIKHHIDVASGTPLGSYYFAVRYVFYDGPTLVGLESIAMTVHVLASATEISGNYDLNFDDVWVGMAGGSRTFTLKNKISHWLFIDIHADGNIADVGGISSGEGDLDFSLLPGESRSIEIFFNPLSTTELSGNVIISITDFFKEMINRTHTLPLSGKGIIQPYGVYSDDTSTEDWSMLLGEVTVGTSGAATLRVENTGNADLIATGITFSDAQFTATPSSFTLPPLELKT
jgi:hypothetical protein